MYTPPCRWLGQRRLFSAVVAVFASLLVLTSSSPAYASDPDVIAELLEHENHAMGSQIRKHESSQRVDRPLILQPAQGGNIEAVVSAIEPGVNGIEVGVSGIEVGVSGIDVASHQGNVEWQYWWNQGKRFAYVKATEGRSYTNPYFTQQYDGSYDVGMIRGAYHFALPNVSSGSAQANYFVDHGGGWSGDGKTLPGTLDIEYNPYGATCYGMSRSAMVAWIKEFSDTYHARTSRWPVIYTSTDWWSRCTGNLGDFSSTNPLWIARYADTPGTLPYAWTTWTFWQYTSSPLDQDGFNGAYDRLQALANGHENLLAAELVSLNSGKCLDVSGADTSDGAAVIQYTCHGGSNQQLQIRRLSNGYQELTFVHSGKCLDVPAFATGDGVELIQWTCNGGTNQQWSAAFRDDSSYERIVNRHSQKCLDVPAFATDDGVELIQWTCNGGTNQQWSAVFWDDNGL
jgi:GH25 family lysozyme M1 (1,4-beta-N-acetylmuramidase)